MNLKTLEPSFFCSSFRPFCISIYFTWQQYNAEMHEKEVKLESAQSFRIMASEAADRKGENDRPTHPVQTQFVHFYFL